MATMIGNALVLGWNSAVESSNPAEDRADGRERATTLGLDEEIRQQRWLAFDRLLQVSFGMIPPAYLFSSLPADF